MAGRVVALVCLGPRAKVQDERRGMLARLVRAARCRAIAIEVRHLAHRLVHHHLGLVRAVPTRRGVHPRVKDRLRALVATGAPVQLVATRRKTSRTAKHGRSAESPDGAFQSHESPILASKMWKRLAYSPSNSSRKRQQTSWPSWLPARYRSGPAACAALAYATCSNSPRYAAELAGGGTNEHENSHP